MYPHIFVEQQVVILEQLPFLNPGYRCLLYHAGYGFQLFDEKRQ